jgi:hypothetical protein
MPIVGSFAGASARAYGLGAGGVGIGDFESIATTTLGSDNATVTFDNIPSTYTHLQIRGFVRTSNSGTGFDDLSVVFNDITTSSYAWHRLLGNGSGSGSSNGAANTTSALMTEMLMRNGGTSNVFSGFVLDVLDYGNTNKNKTIRCLGGVDANGSGQVVLDSGHWRSTSAVTKITLTIAGAYSFKQYSSLALYGVKA